MINYALSSDWACPFPFRILRIESEHDADLGQFSVQFAFLGIGLELVWVFDPNTKLRADLRDQMADESWLTNSRVSLAYADYQELKANADKWVESHGGTNP